jgi:hypothetical protein
LLSMNDVSLLVVLNSWKWVSDFGVILVITIPLAFLKMMPMLLFV